MSRVIVVANRLPTSVRKRGRNLSYQASSGGLATGVGSLTESHDLFWVGWPGLAREKLSETEQGQVRRRLNEEHCDPIFLSEAEVQAFYFGFSNRTIWPLFHYFPMYTEYRRSHWQAYQEVNERFADAVVEHATPNDIIWIHDYQLMLLPQLVRQRLPEAQIGFFLHIPFPSYELFRLLPWRDEILKGLLGADLVGFHTYDYVRHFLSSVCRLCNLEHELGQLTVERRVVKADAFPMGIDYQKYHEAADTQDVQDEVEQLRRQVGDTRVIVSIDRLDYTKGILQRLEAFDLFLSQHPEYHGKVTLVLLAVPSRSNVERYRTLRNQVERLVGHINGQHTAIGWTPVCYLYRSLPFTELMALYRIADVGLVTPLRDGMNLVAKEFVATRNEGRGVLVLSEMAGAASELGEALIVNANDRQEIAGALATALAMPEAEQVERNRSMQARLRRYDVQRWARDVLTSLADTRELRTHWSAALLDGPQQAHLRAHYREAAKRLILLDYDGTLINFVKRPEEACPDAALCDLLARLADDKRNEIVIISGRDRETLGSWLGHLDINMVAEHGGWLRARGGVWHLPHSVRAGWKDIIRPMLDLYVDRTPGASVEEKDFALVWHCRRSNPELARVRMQELRMAILNFTENLDLGVFEGNRILEVKNLGINKGAATQRWLEQGGWDFLLAVGDDYTDEEMFAALPETAYSIKVGTGMSKARFHVKGVSSVRDLLQQLCEGSHVEA